MMLLVIFAALAVALAVIGVFGVLSYSVTQRIPELGVRIALGARSRDIERLVLRQAAWLILAGIAIGLSGAFALTRYIQNLLFEVQPHDWRTYAAAVLLLAGASFVAALIPARRGARVDPITALRYE